MNRDADTAKSRTLGAAHGDHIRIQDERASAPISVKCPWIVRLYSRDRFLSGCPL
jgi:hypothetical protein